MELHPCSRAAPGASAPRPAWPKADQRPGSLLRLIFETKSALCEPGGRATSITSPPPPPNPGIFFKTPDHLFSAPFCSKEGLCIRIAECLGLEARDLFYQAPGSGWMGSRGEVWGWGARTFLHSRVRGKTGCLDPSPVRVP